MTWDTAFVLVTEMGVGFAGGGATVTVRKTNRFRNRANQETGLTAFTVAAAGIAGATEVNLTAPNLRGRLVRGATFTIGATTYEAQEDVETENGVLVVPIDPPLVADVSDGAVATITKSYRDVPYQFCRRQTLEDTIDGQLEAARDTLHLLPIPGEVIELKDIVIADGVQRLVSAVDKIKPGSAIVRWTVALGEINTVPGVNA